MKSPSLYFNEVGIYRDAAAGNARYALPPADTEQDGYGLQQHRLAAKLAFRR